MMVYFYTKVQCKVNVSLWEQGLFHPTPVAITGVTMYNTVQCFHFALILKLRSLPLGSSSSLLFTVQDHGQSIMFPMTTPHTVCLKRRLSVSFTNKCQVVEIRFQCSAKSLFNLPLGHINIFLMFWVYSAFTHCK